MVKVVKVSAFLPASGLVPIELSVHKSFSSLLSVLGRFLGQLVETTLGLDVPPLRSRRFFGRVRSLVKNLLFFLDAEKRRK